MNTSEVLNRAADLIEERGWTQGASGWPATPESTHALCLEGGILAALALDVGAASVNPNEDVPNRCPAGAAVRRYLDLQDGVDLYEWNDGSARAGRTEDPTIEEVIATLRAAAVIEAAKETADERESVSA